MSSLLAFESAARHGNFSRAAKELNIPQPVVSRLITTLERQLMTQLFERSPGAVTLTEAGRRFRVTVTTGLGTIREAAFHAAALPSAEQVVIACSHDASQHYLLPRYDALQDALGDETAIRIVTYHRHSQQLPPYPVADLLLAWEASFGTADYVVLHGEAAGPVCAPQFAANHRETLAQPVSHWGELVFLDLATPNLGWASLDDWFCVAGHPELTPRLKCFDSYSFLLQAAVHGQGIAMARQHYIQQQVETGTLVPLGGGFVNFDKRYCGRLTAQGRGNPLADKCLTCLAGLA